MKKILEDIKTVIVEIIGLIGGLIWAKKSNWEYEPIILILISLVGIITFIIIKLIPSNEKKDASVTKNNLKQTISSPILNAPNALIATIGQSGGTNIIQQKIDGPDPIYNAINSDINNEVDKILPRDSIGKKIIFPSDEFPFNKLFKHSFEITFYSQIPINGFGFMLKKQDVILANVTKNGLIISKSGKTKEGYYFVFATRPENGKYTFTFYTKEPINGLKDLQFFKNI